MSSKVVGFSALAIAVLSLVLTFTGKLGLYISTAQTWLVVGAAVVFILLFVLASRSEPDHDHADHKVSGAVWISVLIVTVIVMTPPNMISGSRIDPSTIRVPDVSDDPGGAPDSASFEKTNVLQIRGGQIDEPISFQGVVGPEREGWVYVYQYALACCVVDLQDSGVMVARDDLPGNVGIGDWVQIDGVAHRDPEDVTWISVTRSQTISPPSNPYLPAGE